MHLPRLRGDGSAAVSPLATLVRAANPGPMTLDGTNSWVLRAPGSGRVVVVDPGPSIAEHLERLAGFGEVELVLLTHHHPDHSESLSEFARLTDAPVRAIDPAFCIDAPPLVDGERIRAAGLDLDVLATPGHTADSVSFVLPGDGDHGSVLTGDTILGLGTTIIADPDGALGPYLEPLRAVHEVVVGDDATVAQVTDLVYVDTDAAVRPAAEASVRAQLVYLRGRA